MLHLSLAVLCSSLVAVLLRLSGKPGLPGLPVIGVNYLAAVALSLLLQGDGLSTSLAALGSMGFLTGAADLSRSVISLGIGAPMGVLYFLAFLVYRRALSESGLGLSGGFAKMGILLPMALSMLFWREFPKPVQWLGIAAALGAVVLGAFRSARGRFAPVLLLVFLLNGLAEFGNKFYQHHGGVAHRDFFLFWVFGVAFLCSLAGILKSRARVSVRAVAIGVPLGIVNYFSSWFLIPALDALNTSVVFSVFGAGTVALLSVAGLFLFGERLSRREAFSLLMVAVALVLVNL